MSMFEHPDYRAGLNNQRSTSTNIFSAEYKKGVADRQFRESHPLFGKPPSSSQQWPMPRGVAPNYGSGSGAGSGSGSKSGGVLKTLGVLLLLVAGYALIHSASDKRQTNTRQAEAPTVESRSTEAPAAEAPSTETPSTDAAAAEAPAAAPVAESSANGSESWGVAMEGANCTRFLKMVEADSRQHSSAVPPLGIMLQTCSKAADEGDAESMVRLGSVYEQGLGVPQNTQQAISWYRAAAKSSDSEAAAEAQKNLQRLGVQ